MPRGAKSHDNALSEAVGALLNDARLEQLLTQAELAERSDISQSQMSKYLHGKRSPTIDELDAMCKVLGLSISGVVADAKRSI